jgi:hypothetical protein
MKNNLVQENVLAVILTQFGVFASLRKTGKQNLIFNTLN